MFRNTKMIVYLIRSISSNNLNLKSTVMKPRLKNASRLSLVALILIATVALISWKKQDKPADQKQNQHAYTDTVPSKDRKVRDLDQALNQLDNLDLQAQIDQAMASVAEVMKNIDAEKLHLEVEKALASVDMEKVNADVKKALKEIDFEKIQNEVKASLEKVNWDEVKIDIENAKKEIDATSKIDFEQINRELAKATEEIKKISPEIEKELAKAKVEIEKIRPELEKELAKAKVDIEKAKEEIREYKNFVDGLEKDGLLDKKDDYSIIHKNGKLIVNGKEASSAVYTKYKSFLDKHKKLNIEKSDDSFNMDDDDKQ
jgi:virulence-associated protein VapD